MSETESLRSGTLVRFETGDEGTFGELLIGDFKCVTVELPWRRNAKGKSCVPPGDYIFRWRTDSPKHGECYEADPDTEATGRTNIQIHSANLAGDTEKGYVSQLEGCIAPGRVIVQFKARTPPAGERNQFGVVSSLAAVKELVEKLNKKPFTLKISWLTEPA